MVVDAVGEMQRAWDHPAPRGARPAAVSHLSPWGSKGRLSRWWALAHHHRLSARLNVLQGDADSCFPEPNPAASPAQEAPTWLHAPRPCRHLPGVAMLACSLCGLETSVPRKRLEAPS